MASNLQDHKGTAGQNPWYNLWTGLIDEVQTDLNARVEKTGDAVITGNLKVTSYVQFNGTTGLPGIIAHVSTLGAGAAFTFPSQVLGGIMIIREFVGGKGAVAFADPTEDGIIADVSALVSLTDPGAGSNKLWLDFSNNPQRIVNRFTNSREVRVLLMTMSGGF